MLKGKTEQNTHKTRHAKGMNSNLTCYLIMKSCQLRNKEKYKLAIYICIRIWIEATCKTIPIV